MLTIARIRALQTSDLRVRKFSGRHQISSDGKHLIDGVAFGRPFLRSGTRPTVQIPPRKRQRISYDEWDGLYDSVSEEVEVEGDEQWNGLEDDDSGSDSVDEPDMSEELEGLIDDAAEIQAGNEIQVLADDDGPTVTRSRSRNRGLGLTLPLYGPYHNPLLDEYSQDEPASMLSAFDTGIGSPHAQYATRSHKKKKGNQALVDDRRHSIGSDKSVRFDDEEGATPATVRLTDMFDDADADDDDDEEFIPAEGDDSDKENTQPMEFGSANEEHLRSASASDSASLEDEATSSSGTSVTSSADSEDRQAVLRSDDKKIVPHRIQSATVAESQGLPDSSKLSGKDDAAGSIVNVPPGLGSKGTQKRNQRRRQAKRLKLLKSKGVIPQDATIEDLNEHADSSAKGIEEATQPVTATSNVKARIAAFEAKRQALLDPSASDHVTTAEVEHAAISGIEKHGAERSPSQTEQWAEQNAKRRSQDLTQEDAATLKSIPTTSQVPDSYQEHSLMQQDATYAYTDDLSSRPIDAQEKDHSFLEQSPRRARLDLASSKRMLFASLGLRTPKNKEEEAALREKLSKNVRPQRKQPSISDGADDYSKQVDPDDDDEAWRSKIHLKAVECCYDGIKLSTPPFPFVQRWDPQQQQGYQAPSSKKSRKGKKRKRDNDDLTGDVDKQPSPPKILRLESHDPAAGNTQFHESVMDNEELRNDERDTQFTHADSDLPPLPHDIKSDPTLVQNQCLPGAVVAFKRFLMSAETNWQPRISDYVTASVDHLSSDDTLSVTLAKRDQSQDDARFDEVTGKRLYAKFEMPEFEDSTLLDKSKLQIAFNELIEPHLIRPATEADQLADPAPNGSAVGSQESSKDHSVRPADLVGNSTVGAEGDQAIRSESREEILGLIRDAGWKSSLGSETGKDLTLNEEAGWKSTLGSDTGKDSTSNGREHGLPAAVVNEHTDHARNLRDDQILSSPPFYATAPEKQSSAGPQLPAIPKTQVEPESSIVQSDNVTYPLLDGANEEHESVGEERQHRSISFDDDGPAFPQSSISPPTLRSRRPRTFPDSSPGERFQPTGKLGAQVDGGNESSDEFPELFSQAFDDRMSREPGVKEESSQSQPIRSFAPARAISSTARNTDKKKDLLPNSKSFRSSAGNYSDSGDENFPPAYSQKLRSSQVIDLTQSSDRADLFDTTNDENDDSSFRPDSDGGWVYKPRANKTIGVTTRSSSRRKTKSR